MTISQDFYVRVELWDQAGTFGSAEFRKITLYDEKSFFELKIAEFMNGAAGDGNWPTAGNRTRFYAGET